MKKFLMILITMIAFKVKAQLGVNWGGGIPIDWEAYWAYIMWLISISVGMI